MQVGLVLRSGRKVEHLGTRGVVVLPFHGRREFVKRMEDVDRQTRSVPNISWTYIACGSFGITADTEPEQACRNIIDMICDMQKC